MIITEVRDKKTIKEFLNVARVIYKGDPAWVCPLDNDVENIFRPEKNNFHKHGVITRWVAKNGSGALIGRIAAFINYNKADSFSQPTGGIGFFECIDDEATAFALFNTAKDWLQQRGMQAMDGPINFGENDTFWGLLVDGFTQPSYGMNYNPPYYKKLFESYGFFPLYEQITNHLDVNKPFPERFTKIAQWVIKKPGYRFEHLKVKEIDRYAADFMEIYNDAWEDFDNFVPIRQETIREAFNKMKILMDENLIWFSYVNNEPASFVIILPDANQIIKSFKGKLGFLEKLKFLYYRWKGVSRMRAIVMGTKKAYQKHGLESAMFIKLKEYVIPLKQYNELELSWVGDFNEKMLAIHEATGAVFGKKHATLRKIFE
ncbi:GNAT family N-acetyltransferase [Arcticibacter tournemirensis]|uniref:GNAT family N-acetyltransferase n=1 Tax=Arcticibacter tournemirensis TaxID=699437 RepID=A0A4Q0M3A1_9SPHI|nr:GNAT family N-acetyltransferase [Arcticibacter tournemirensis]RXF67377.1 GNAT family N-acetyltransferase [Arcticibacter tournemirensis]